MNEAKVTVAIPTFNRAKWLRESIESVLAQSFSSFHLIVGDNASDDETPDVVEALDDERITYVRSERNLGAVANLNRLIGLANTEYLVLLPDDDILYPGYLEAAIGLLERFRNVGLVHSAFHQIDHASHVFGQVDPVRCRSAMTIESGNVALERLMVSTWWLCFASVTYRTQALVAAGGFRAELGPFCDREVWMQLALDWDFGYLAAPLVAQRAHASTTTAMIATDRGVNSDERESFRQYSELDFERRTSFLDNAGLEHDRARQLRALATLQLLIDSASAGLQTSVIARRLGQLVRTYPRIILRPAFWRLVAAQGGGRQLRSSLKSVSKRASRLVKPVGA